MLAAPLQKIEAIHFRHLKIGNDEIHGLFFEDADRLAAIFSGHGLQTAKADPVFQEDAKILGVVNNQNFFQMGKHRGSPCAHFHLAGRPEDGQADLDQLHKQRESGLVVGTAGMPPA
jgi:hypothetical protein